MSISIRNKESSKKDYIIRTISSEVPTNYYSLNSTMLLALPTIFIQISQVVLKCTSRKATRTEIKPTDWHIAIERCGSFCTTVQCSKQYSLTDYLPREQVVALYNVKGFGSIARKKSTTCHAYSITSNHLIKCTSISTSIRSISIRKSSEHLEYNSSTYPMEKIYASRLQFVKKRRRKKERSQSIRLHLSSSSLYHVNKKRYCTQKNEHEYSQPIFVYTRY